MMNEYGLNVLLLHPFSQQNLIELGEHLSSDVNLVVGTATSPLDGCEILITDEVERVQLEANPKVRAIIIPYSGVPAEIRQLIGDFPHITIHNLHHTAAPTAEMAVALLLAAARLLIPADRTFRTSGWSINEQSSATVLLEGKTALILGYGRIGQRVARVCHALGMSVLATRRNICAPVSVDVPAEIHPPSALHRLLSRAHVLMVTLPLTPETKGLIGAAELMLLPRGALLVNVGRGPIVEESALYHALQNGTLAAAGLDVWYNYPVDEEHTHDAPSKYPFHELENVVMSPHVGGTTPESDRYGVIQLAAMLNAAAHGEPLPNQVDLQAGY